MRFRHALPLALAGTAAAAVASVALVLAMRRGIVGSDPRLFASVAAAVFGMSILAFAAAVRARSIAGALFSAGLLLVYGGGMTNFLFSLQGYALLTEFESIPLEEGRALQAFEAGPLSDLAEMDLRLQLERLELLPAGDGFVPRSRVRIVRKGQDARVLELSQSKGVSDGTLRLIQGAFGFAPRIVVTRDGNAVFDRHVPFTTRRAAGDGVAFEETFRIESENLTVRSALDLRSLSDDLRGHARLGVSVSRGAEQLGSGELTMGHFAKLSDGSYIGYAGLKRWAEIDISRRNYREPVLAGLALIVVSVLVAPFTRRRA